MQGQQQVAPKTEQIIREGGAQAMDPSSVNVAPKPTMADALSRNQSSAVGGASQPASIVSTDGVFSRPAGYNLPEIAETNRGLYSPGVTTNKDYMDDLAPIKKPSMYARTVGGLGGYGNIVPGVLAGGAGAMAARPIEEEERRRKEIQLAKPYSQPVTYPGAGYGSREYSYFGPNYGLYAKEGGHIKQMQEGGAVDTTTGADIPVSAFSGDLMSYAPGIVGDPNVGYDYMSYVPENYQSPVGISSLGSGREQVIGDPNALQNIQKDIAREEAEKDLYLTGLLGTKIKVPPGMLKRRSDPYFQNNLYTGQDARRMVGRDRLNQPIYAKEGGLIGMQEGGITSLPQTEGQVEGNGDGMSDEVYGDIENQQEVALSKDEFIVPADVVSGLGNGSSNAGASKLYEMMARVRKARTGKESQPEEIEAEEFMPA
jgi:hypothetical protein